MGSEADIDRIERPDIEVAARVKADRLTFKRVPRTDVETRGEWVHDSERTNLPDRVEPGVTYRDVDVLWHAAARLR